MLGKLLTGIFIFGFYINAMSQAEIVTISQSGSVETCNAAVFDSGGNGPADYGNNENYIYTFCPDTPGDVIYMQFLLFDLDQTGDEDDWDRIIVYDGPNTGSNSLGVYTGTSAQNMIFSGSNLNTSGCLTIRFISNNEGTGNYAMSVTCTTPCERPTAVATDDGPANNLICVGDEINFDASASYAEDGFSIVEYQWVFGDGQDTTTTEPFVSHSFAYPGEFIVQLFVIDDNGCVNSNLIDLQFLASTFPSFDPFPGDTTICVNEEILLEATPNAYEVEWSGSQGELTGETICNADEVGIAFYSEQFQSGFDPGAIIQSPADIVSICLDMEHSFLGDLLLQLECPNGQSIILHQQGGGGVFLGEPIDDGSDPCEFPGVGYVYCFSEDGEETWAEWGNSNFGTLPDDVDYLTVDDFSGLEGCPLGGVWSLIYTDLWGADDGTLFSWGITFAPELYPDVTEFTPNLGHGADSSSWGGTSGGIVSGDGNTLDFSSSTPGEYPFTFNLINNHGCEFDSTVTVTVMDPPAINAGEDVFMCNEAVQLQGGIDGLPTPECSDDAGTYEICLGQWGWEQYTFCPDASGAEFTAMQINFESGFLDLWDDYVTVYNGPDSWPSPVFPNGNFNGVDVSGMSFTADNTTGCITVTFSGGSQNNCATGGSEPIIFTVTCVNGGLDLVYSWDPPTGLSNPNIINPMVTVNEAIEYTITAYMDGYPHCAGTDQVMVSLDPEVDPGTSTDTIICPNSPSFQLIDYLGGNPVTTGTWTNNATGEVFGNQLNPSNYSDGATFDLTYTTQNGNCIGEAHLNLVILEATDQTCCQTSADAGPDVVVCDLTYQLNAGPTTGYGEWTGPPNVTFSNPNDRNAIVTCEAPGGEVTLTWTDYNGFMCEESDEVVVVFSVPMEVQAIGIDTKCYNNCDGEAVATGSGGLVADDYIYTWSSGEQNVLSQMRKDLCAGQHYVTIEDDFGCKDSIWFSINQPDKMILTPEITRPSCTGDCDGKITMNSPTAVQFKFDEYSSFTPNNQIETLCAGDYLIYAMDENNCLDSTYVTVMDPQELVAEFKINPNPTTIKNTFIEFSNLSHPLPLVKTEWTFGSPALGVSTEFSPSFTFPKDTSGIYPVVLYIENSYGCYDSLTYDVIIHPALQFYIPNAFTPNGDAINDIWRPVINTIDVEDYELKIYNRWGEVVFSTDDPMEGWNGTGAGGEYVVPGGVYVYFIKLVSSTDKEKREVTGNITLFR